MKKKIVLCTKLPEDKRKEIEAYCDITEAGELKHGKGNVTEDLVRQECTGFELVVLGDEYASKETLEDWIQSGMKFIGVAKGTPVTVDNSILLRNNIPLSYTPGRNRVAVAEYTLGLMIDLARKIALSYEGLRKGDHTGPVKENIYDVPKIKNVTFGPLDQHHPFSDYGIGFELYGKVLGLAGFGAIGKEVAKRAMAFGMKIYVYDPYVPQEVVEQFGAKYCSLDEMLGQSDMVSIHLPVLESTQNIVNKDWFDKMKPTAYVINTARAAVIDQKDFVEALTSKKIAGAAVDVYWQEPVPVNHPLLRMRNVLCTPHMAGLTSDVDGWSGKMMADEILAYLKGEERKYIWKRA